MKIGSKFLKNFIQMLFLQTAWVLAFYGLFNQNTEYIGFSLTAGAMSSILGALLLARIGNTHQPSMGFLLVFLCCLYFELSIIKYPLVNAGYNGFITDPWTKLFGDFLVFISVLSTISFCKTSFAINIETIEEKNSTVQLMAWILSLGLLVFNVYTALTSVSYYSTFERDLSTKTQVLTLVSSIISCFALYYCALYWRRNFVTKVPSVMYLIGLASMTIKQGSRSILVTEGLILIYFLVVQRKLANKLLVFIYKYAPLMVLGISYITFSVARPDRLPLIAEDLQYRFDLSSFSMTILERTSYFRLEFGEIVDGIKKSIPSILLSNKDTFTYKCILESVGLNSIIDYTDSIFSVGAIFLGVIGMVILLPIAVGLINKYQKHLFKKHDNKKAVFYMVFFASMCIALEFETTFYIPRIRNYILAIIVANIGWFVLRKTRVRNRGRQI